MLHSVPGAGRHEAHQLRGVTPGALLSHSPHPHPTRTEPRAGWPCRATSRPQVVLRRRVCFHRSRRQFLSVAPEKGWSPLFVAQSFLGKWCQRVKARPTATDSGFNQNPASQAPPRLPARASAGHQSPRRPLPSEPGSMPSCSWIAFLYTQSTPSCHTLHIAVPAARCPCLSVKGNPTHPSKPCLNIAFLKVSLARPAINKPGFLWIPLSVSTAVLALAVLFYRSCLCPISWPDKALRARDES